MSVSSSSLQSEYAALRNAASFRVARERIIVRFTGDDRLTFLHGMCSNDIQNLKPGGVLEALVLTEHAHVIAGFYAFARENDLLIEIDREIWPRARTHLEKFLVADDVEIDEIDALGVVEVIGPKSVAAVAAITDTSVVDLPQWRFVEIGDREAGDQREAMDQIVARFPRYGSEAFTMIAPAAHLDTLISRLSRSTPDVIAVGEAAIELIRIENGIAKIGVDTNEKTIALEARLESTISYSKGCYLGQETIERATARGGLKKKLFGLRVEAPIAPAIGSPILLDDKEVGRISSAAVSPRFGVIAFAMLHHSAWTPSTALTINNGSSTLAARVSDLPFA